jgi:hypothetical protein
MLFEELTLRPTSGAVDVPAVTAKLDSLPHAFHDPVAGDGWHLSATPRLMELNRQQRIDRPRDFPLGIRVRVAPDHVWLAARADNDDLARGLELVQWLVRDGWWTAEVDGGAPEPVTDPRRLFPDDLPDPGALIDDPTVSPISEGTLVTWNVEHGAAPRSLAIHSSGQWRYSAGDRTLRGRLTVPVREPWNAAVAAVDTDDPELPAEPDPATAVAIELSTPDGHEWVNLDPAAPPAAYRPLVAMISRWLTALEGATTAPTLS